MSEDGLNLVINGETEVPFAQIFRDEKIELAETGVYPTQVSDQTRACEDLGVVNNFPAPYFYDADGFLYTLDPVNDLYISDFDEAAGPITSTRWSAAPSMPSTRPPART